MAKGKDCIANVDLAAEKAMMIGMAAGIMFLREEPSDGEHRPSVLIGKEPRLSGYMIESALAAGFVSAGVDVLPTGPMPQGGIAMLTRSMRCALGVMISAGRLPYEYNAIKLFGPDGRRISSEAEAQIAGLAVSDMSRLRAKPHELGRAKRIEGAQERYVEYVKRSSLTPGVSFEGWRIVVDCAHGAGYQVIPQALRELGAEVVAVGVEPNGLNINDNSCAIVTPHILSDKVRERRADVGIAFSGDAVEAIFSDDKGRIFTQDQLQKILEKNDGRSGLPEGVEDGLITALRVLSFVRRSGNSFSKELNKLLSSEE